MSTLNTSLVAALAPVREALLAVARADAERTRERAAAEADAVLAAARERADAVRAAARAEGTADAAGVLAAEHARARRGARSAVLRARRETYEALRAQARAAVSGLTAEPAYADLRDRLVAEVRGRLGPQAAIRDVPGGGIAGEVCRQRIDLSLASMSDRFVDEIAAKDPP
jgi:cell division septum initiation protein DivIVA